MKIRLPFMFMYERKGKRKFTLDISRISEFLDISKDCIDRLAKVFGPPVRKIRQSRPLKKIDYASLAAEYQQILDSGKCKNRADVARHFGVSRAWVTMVMRKQN